MKLQGLVRFLLIVLVCTVYRFYLGKLSPNFLWFFVLYLPIINWGVYWLMSIIRFGLNKSAGREILTEFRLRRIYVWYLNFPGALALAELIYRGYVFNT
jgi:hypothetical protein